MPDFEEIQIIEPEQEHSSPLPSRSQNEKDEFDVFGELIAAQLKTLPLPRAIKAQEYIQTYLNKCRLENYRNYDS